MHTPAHFAPRLSHKLVIVVVVGGVCLFVCLFVVCLFVVFAG